MLFIRNGNYFLITKVKIRFFSELHMQLVRIVGFDFYFHMLPTFDFTSVLLLVQSRSWQNMAFEPRPISFIKIVGTRNTANEVGILYLTCVSVCV